MNQRDAINLIVPGGTLTQTYGWTRYAQQGAYGGRIHDGWDIAQRRGTRINWPQPVSRTYAGIEPGGYGNYTIGYSGPWEFLFGHELAHGNVGYAGLLDSTGYSTGDHTHLRVRLNGVTVDPQVFFNQLGGSVPNYPDLRSQNDKNKLQAVQRFIEIITGNYHDERDVRAHHFGTDAEFTEYERNQLADKFFASQEYIDSAVEAYQDAYNGGKPATGAKLAEWQAEAKKKAAARVTIPHLREELMKNLPQAAPSAKLDQAKQISQKSNDEIQSL